jgi:hypothetical protein
MPPRTPAIDSLPKEERPAVERVRRFFLAADEAERRRLAKEVAALPAYRPERVRDWLHAADLHRPLPPGVTEVEVPIDKVDLDEDRSRPVAVRVPDGYTPDRPWPLVMAYHPTGGSGPGMLMGVERCLGPDVERFVVAAPTGYRPANVDSKRCISTEHPSVLLHLKKTLHVDSDRVYVIGFSGGGYAAWSLATFFTDQYAGAMPVGCTFDAAPEIPGLWDLLLPNLTGLPVLHVWGDRDELQALGFDLRTPRGAINDLNPKLAEQAGRLGLDVTNHVIPGGVHSFDPPADKLRQLLERKRAYPPRVVRRFRHLHQSPAVWLEGRVWDGDHWGLIPPKREPRPGESREQAIGRIVGELLGRLTGDIHGQTFAVDHDHLAEFTVWFGDGPHDWAKPVTVRSNGKVVFDGRVERDLFVCLSEARRTFDFERLRWAGLRVTKDGRVRPE